MAKKEQDLIKDFQMGIESLNKMLDVRYQVLINKLKEEMEKFSTLLEWAFDPDVNKAFEGSVHLAEFVGVQKESILWDINDIDVFFMT